MKTGWPPGLLQDDDRKLSRWFANRPDARYQLRKNMKRELYDFFTPPDTPKEVHTTMYYFPHKLPSSLGLVPTGPAFREPPCMAAHYDKLGNLLFTRFIFSDGTWKDDK